MKKHLPVWPVKDPNDLWLEELQDYSGRAGPEQNAGELARQPDETREEWMERLRSRVKNPDVSEPREKIEIRIGKKGRLFSEATPYQTQDERRKKQELAEEFLRAARRSNPDRLQELIAMGAPVNWQERGTGATALHYLASHAARSGIRVLIKNRDLNYLIRDKRGWLSSDMALVYGRDGAIARLLRQKEAQQARREGINLSSRRTRST